MNDKVENMSSILYYSREDDIIEMWTYKSTIFCRHPYWCQKVCSIDNNIVILPPMRSQLRAQIRDQKEKPDHSGLRIICEVA
jgi:hypothetical protein